MLTTLTNIKLALLTHRADTGESARKVAQKLNIHPYVLSQYATGDLEMPLDRRENLAKILGVESQFLLGTSDFEINE